MFFDRCVYLATGARGYTADMFQSVVSGPVVDPLEITVTTVMTALTVARA